MWPFGLYTQKWKPLFSSFVKKIKDNVLTARDNCNRVTSKAGTQAAVTIIPLISCDLKLYG